MSKNINTECGLVSIVTREEISSKEIISSLTKLQHRGRESYGIAYLDKQTKSYNIEKYMGLLNKYELSENIVNIKSNNWAGHVRYSTSGKKNDKSSKSTFSFLTLTQPIKFKLKIRTSSQIVEKEAIFIYNGNIPLDTWKIIFKKYRKLNDYYYENILGKIDINDSMLIIKLIQILGEINGSVCDILKEIINLIDRAFCIVIKFIDEEWIIRDRYGVRPLVIGLSNDFKSIIVASENSCFDSIKYNTISTIKPGTISRINYKTFNIKEEYVIPNNIVKKHCIFEYFYFMRKNTIVNNINVTLFRENIGKLLFNDIKKKQELYSKLVDYVNKKELIVCGIPESGIIQAKSFCRELNGIYVQFIEKNKINFKGERTFILDNNKSRINACKQKYIISKYYQKYIKDKVVVLVDDSIVRGNTIKYLIEFVRYYKPKEIHFLSASPPIINKCSYGVDFPDIEDLIASKNTTSQIEQKLNINSLTYLDINNFNKQQNLFCLECFN